MEELAEENFILFNEDFYLNDKIIENAKTLGSFLIWLLKFHNGTLSRISSSIS